MKNENTRRRRKCYFALTLTFKVETTIWGSNAIFPRKPDKAANSPESRENAKLDLSCMESIIFTWFSSCRSQALLFWLRTYHGKTVLPEVCLSLCCCFRSVTRYLQKKISKKSQIWYLHSSVSKMNDWKPYLFSFEIQKSAGQIFCKSFSNHYHSFDCKGNLHPNFLCFV